MHIPLWTTLLYAARHNGPVLEQRASPNICLPLQLQAAVPSCAYQCLQAFIANNYNTLDCTSTANINFLCTTPTYSGLTIGEGSLQCVVSTCLAVDIETQSGYTICDGISGAIPEMAGTITATISAVTTFVSTSDSSTASFTSTPAVSFTSNTPSTSTTSQVLESSLSDPATPFTSFASSTSLFNDPSPPVETSAAPSTIASISVTTSASSSEILGSSISTTSLTSATTSIATRTPTSKSSTSSSTTSSATAAAATEDPTESKLGTSAIAGIVTAVAIVSALLLGFLAYWCFVRRKEKKRRSQHFSTVSGPSNAYDPNGSAFATQEDQYGVFTHPARRFYSQEPSQDKRTSFWRGSALPPYNIGVAIAASTRVSPERGAQAPIAQQSHAPWSSPTIAMQIDRAGPYGDTGRWSPADSSDEDVEAHAQQNQDLPALASPRTRRSSRSISSIVVEKPAPLRLNNLKPRPEAPTRDIIPLTPVYDNGNFEPTIRQVVEGSTQPAGLVRLSRERQTPNFSRREPSLTRNSQDDARPMPPQVRQPIQMTRFPVKPMAPFRKESETTDRSMSVHTEFEEDSTPEEEDDTKQLRPQRPPIRARVPLHNVQYPPVPRPAATRRQAELPHSPRALTVRRVDPTSGPSPSQNYAARAALAPEDPNLTILNVSSNTSLASRSSESPIFPTPPPRNPARLTRLQPQHQPQTQQQQHLRSQIADAYRVASRPLTTTSMSSTSMRPASEYPTYPPSAYPGAATAARYGGNYESPSLQRLSAPRDRDRDRGRGRPLANRMQAQGYIPRQPPAFQREEPTMVLNRRYSGRYPTGSTEGDLYFRVHGIRR